ncbi:phosphoadenylyl-sulfate reductase [Psychrobium sp. 1_MG-2023]|uniref:phosphoadenylyl-sulfate reductase n=1 Tax=Psychrobium sp. 1_MG-2023 TaxID=3062624 RepID=UPI000C344B4F|nr:phosphoadenylyl-sulfate reductase [Psychrobium sp. 1_MG-2023]MDP2560096.1 phosphoadenylyl-sulfate reductase [Psychrobium sp. 1_MG-2023]PKF56246.1 phosphoadenosine phosphosulfate reductase [Alteromonadales bacterium alter-6D02]
MTKLPLETDFVALLDAPKSDQQAVLTQVNQYLTELSPAERVAWALENLPGTHALSSSFGIQSAFMLHLLNAQKPDIPVILTDTGHLFEQTYQFIDTLTTRFNLNLKVYQSAMSPAWQQARFGKEWEQGLDGIEAYNQRNKVEPMQRALKELNVGTWYSGLRSSQASSREGLPIVEIRGDKYKFLPIIDQNNKQVHEYLTEFDLPYHPLWEEGYVSLGDVHTTRKLEPGMSEEETRFNGLKRECGLHFEI